MEDAFCSVFLNSFFPRWTQKKRREKRRKKKRKYTSQVGRNRCNKTHMPTHRERLKSWREELYRMGKPKFEYTYTERRRKKEIG